MTRYVVVRVWLADRPGSLGQLASKIGAVGGDLVGIDILERDGARAVDELTVELPDGFSPESLAAALSDLPGVEVEDLRHLVSRVPYSGRDPLDAAVLMAEAIGPAELLNVLAQGVCVAFACDWSTVLDMGESTATALAAAGDPPSAAWLGAFVAGARAGLSRSPSEGFGLVGPATSLGRRSIRRTWWCWQEETGRHSTAGSVASSISCAVSDTQDGRTSSAMLAASPIPLGQRSPASPPSSLPDVRFRDGGQRRVQVPGGFLSRQAARSGGSYAAMAAES